MGGNRRITPLHSYTRIRQRSSSYCDAFSVLTPQEFLNLFVTCTHQLLGNPPIKIVYNTWAELDGFRCKWGMSEPHEIGRNSKGSEISPPPEICNACHITSMGSLIGCVWRKLQLMQCIFKIKIDWLPSSCLVESYHYCCYLYLVIIESIKPQSNLIVLKLAINDFISWTQCVSFKVVHFGCGPINCCIFSAVQPLPLKSEEQHSKLLHLFL